MEEKKEPKTTYFSDLEPLENDPEYAWYKDRKPFPKDLLTSYKWTKDEDKGE